ncbi:MAG: hypothetical protein BGP06_07710 [Rhizobiales bacterium 65-9]|nr:septal ring lytic transglycosylase RlpA family protein [Hyphomicrobiales bacterium]OJY35686.1 MAG: hypothetical protein BGP06_07710 [Rhizobiales bacterium 65-9]
MSLAVVAGLTVANCAQQGRLRAGYSDQERREIGAFAHSKYGRASERVVADGEAVPKGGGRDLVGRAYSVAGRTYRPFEKKPGYTEVGMASWYGVAFHGRRTANGEVFDRYSISAAHKTMPLPSYARVSNLANGRSIVVRVNDRGPYHGGRIVDVSQRVADLLDFRSSGSGRVKLEYLGRASLAGSDDRKLVATLSTDGSTPLPAGFGGQSRVMVASLDDSSQSYPASGVSSGFGLFQRASTASEPAPQPAPEAPVVASPAPAAPATALAMAPVQQPIQQSHTIRQANVVVASAASVGATVSLPLPPARPFDLATIPNASTPVMQAVPGVVASAAPLPPMPQRAKLAAMFYAEPAQITGRFARSDPFAALKGQSFRALRAQPEQL